MSQEFYNNILDLVNQKGFYFYEFLSDFEKFKEDLPSKKSFIAPWPEKILVPKNMSMLLMLGTILKWKQLKIILTCIEHVKFYC